MGLGVAYGGRKMLLRLLLPLISAIVAVGAPSSWTHPGVLIGAEQLAYVKAHLPEAPFAAAFAKAVAHPLASHAYKAAGPPASGIIDCGSYSKPDHGCSAEDADGSAAYLQLVLFALTENHAYAATAVAVLDAYAGGLRGYNNSNAPLQAAWGLSKWARAAELAVHLPGVGWPAASASAFVATMRAAALPHVVNCSPSNGNWHLSMIEALIGFAVHVEDGALFDRAAGFWRARVAAYWYNAAADGGAPLKPPCGAPSWYDQVVFNASTSGVAQETCRDEGHTSYSVAATSNAAETALLQGVDLWSPAAERLATAFDFQARLLLPGVKSPPTLCGGRAVDVGGGANMPTYEVAYNRLHNALGRDLPNVLSHITGSVRAPSNSGVDEHMMVFETLTHGGSTSGRAAA